MKKEFYTTKRYMFIFIIMILISMYSCRKRDNSTDTFQRNESFYMYINGKYWEPKIPGLFIGGYFPTESSISYYPEDSIIVFYANNMETDEEVSFSAKIFQIGNYNLKKSFHEINSIAPLSDSIRFKTRFVKNSEFQLSYILKDSINTQLLITKFDTLHKKIVGSFFLTLINSENKIIKITNGSFNSNYSNQIIL